MKVMHAQYIPSMRTCRTLRKNAEDKIHSRVDTAKQGSARFVYMQAP